MYHSIYFTYLVRRAEQNTKHYKPLAQVLILLSTGIRVYANAVHVRT